MALKWYEIIDDSGVDYSFIGQSTSWLGQTVRGADAPVGGLLTVEQPFQSNPHCTYTADAACFEEIPESEVPIIFLDIDGVLHIIRRTGEMLRSSEDLVPPYGLPAFDEDCVDILNKIGLQTGAKIVLISSWRRYATIPLKMQMHFDRQGVKVPLVEYAPLCDGTWPGRNVGDEVTRYLEEHGHSRYLILDDCDMGYREHSSNWIKLRSFEGLTLEAFSESVKILRG